MIIRILGIGQFRLDDQHIDIDPAEIFPSDIIVPPADMTLEEAKKVFSGDGLIKG
ncbi:MAG: hypothetical protein CG443_178 [Methanosaeta sp. ASP1-1]|nr:MAG: hypothetical protein CG443_178 [Methanosaeta sp. ASP1-1]